jgi:peptide methionine sulfoxide reductase msrA/msrB
MMVEKIMFIVAFLISVGLFLCVSETFSCQIQKTGSETNEFIGSTKNLESAIFAGGCFWCIEAVYDGNPGVYSAVSGYTGGDTENPTYEEVTSGTTGHYEAVEVKFDPEIVTYEELLMMFWKNIDPTDSEGQFADKGTQYLTAIFYDSLKQEKQAKLSKEEIQKEFEKPIVTAIIPREIFYEAEEYHQDYSQKKVLAYLAYEKGSGRKDFIDEKWGGEE